MALSFPLMLPAFWFSSRVGQGWKMERESVSLVRVCGRGLRVLLIRQAVLGRLTALAQPGSLLRCIRRRPGPARGPTNAKLFFLPVHLRCLPELRYQASSFHSPWAWLTLSVLLGAAGLRRRDPRLGFLLTWWGVALLPVLDIRQLSFPQVADRFSDLPSVGLCLAISYLCFVRLAPSTCLGMRSALVALALPAFLFCFWMLKVYPGHPGLAQQ